MLVGEDEHGDGGQPLRLRDAPRCRPLQGDTGGVKTEETWMRSPESSLGWGPPGPPPGCVWGGGWRWAAPILCSVPSQAACFALLGVLFMIMSLSFIIIDWATGGGRSGGSH